MIQKLNSSIFKNFYSGFKLKQFFCVQNQLTRTIGIQQPQLFQLNLQKQENIPVILRKPNEQLVNQWWSETPFDKNEQLMVPIFNFQTGEYSGESVELPQDIFNVPLRRDLVHKAMLWRQNLYYIRTALTRNKATTAGSGKKPTPQKGQGRARRGNKRAPGQKKGGKVFGQNPQIMRYPLNKKVRLQALYVMLSAKLAEGKLRVIDSESIEIPKTKVVANILDQFDDKSRILVIHGYNPDQNFIQAQQNIQRIKVTDANRVSVLKLLKQERIFITKEGLQQLTQDLRDRKYLKYRNRTQTRVPLNSEIQRREASGEVEQQEEAKYVYDPTKPLKFKFRILNDYLEQYEQVRKDGKLDDFKIKY